jgi:hypothetical protein
MGDIVGGRVKADTGTGQLEAPRITTSLGEGAARVMVARRSERRDRATMTSCRKN